MNTASEGILPVAYFAASRIKADAPKAKPAKKDKPAAAPAQAAAAAPAPGMPAAELEALQAKISAQGTKVATMKKGGADAAVVKAEVDVLLALKKQLPASLQPKGGKSKGKKKKGEKQKGAAQKQNPSKKKPKKDKPQWNAPGTKAKKKPKKAKAPVEKFVNTTPPGEKKDMSAEMAAGYNPPAVESSWDAWWEKSGFYSADVAKATGQSPVDEKFVMVIPPPNVTGTLHIGHALTVAIEDTLSRWHRMCGHEVMWLPGTDHAGIATQAVVERILWRDNQQTRHDLGREAFLAKVWEWKDSKGATILNQIRRLGASVDHSRTAFTMDAKLTKAVKEAFVRMFDKGLIYRDTRLVNWSHALNTAISDIEVDHVDLTGRSLRSVPGHDPKKKYEFGVIIDFAYKVHGSESGEEVVVATTRLETMLGDTGVAVHPEDPRYTHLHGGFVVHPFNDRKIPIILDDVLVDMAFGTGAVKVTPSHDPNDFQCGRRHKLPEISILNDDGSVNEEGGALFAGMMRFDARVAIEKKLGELGLLRGKRDNPMQLPLCSRSGDVIEPRLKPQWWVDCKDMAARAAQTVRDKELTLMPKFHENTWFRWLDNSRDWCISRQLWWGHRIPAYRVVRKGEALPETEDGATTWVVGRTLEEATASAAKKLGVDASTLQLYQDEDVLDTWFSSGLFPFSVFGWPDNTADLKAFFPGTLLETGHDILFFWVARMVMMSLTLMDVLPFTTVYLHAMVRDKYGRKMSKSLGNVIDPVKVIEGCTLEELHKTLHAGNLAEKEIAKAEKGQKLDFPEGIPECGADALRFGLLAYTVQGRDVNLDIQRVVAYRQFCNKLWNATKFAMLNLKAPFAPKADFEGFVAGGGALTVRDRWVLNRLAATVSKCNECMRSYSFAGATTALHSFWLYDLCDTYLEAVKPIMYNAAAVDGSNAAAAATREVAQNVLFICLDYGLRLMHPICPFVTEELWQRLPHLASTVAASPSIMVAPYPVAPKVAPFVDESAAADMAKTQEVCKAIRSLATQYSVQNKRGLRAFVVTADPAAHKALSVADTVEDIGTLANVACTVLPVGGGAAAVPEGCVKGAVSAAVSIYLEIKDAIDVGKEIARLGGSLKKLAPKIAQLQKKMGAYTDKVPQGVRDRDAAQLLELEAKQGVVKGSIAQFEALK